jgi:predicted ATP-dependent serine protease
MDIHQEEYVCEHCGNTTPIPNDHCPACGQPMSILGAAPVKKKTDDELLSDDEIAASGDDSVLSLDQLQAEEHEEDDSPESAENL